MDRSRERPCDIQDAGVRRWLHLAEILRQAEALVGIEEIKRVNDIFTLDPPAKVWRNRVVELYAVGESGVAAFRRGYHGSKHSGAVELVVVAMIEMVGLPAHTQLAIDFDDAGLLGIGFHLDDARHRILIDARHRLHGVVLERPEDGADRYLHLARGLDIFKDNHAAILKDMIDLLADRLVLHVPPRDARNPRTKRKIILQR